jgi:hypothetical protein
MVSIGRYSEIGVELKWIPENKTILQLGFANTYEIERSDSSIGIYQQIAKINTFNKAKWEALIDAETDLDKKSNLEMTMDFLFAKNNNQPTKVNLENGIGELNEQKTKEDMINTVIVLNATKDNKVAEALGLYYIDKSIIAGHTYFYRIKLNTKSDIYKIENGEVKIKCTTNKEDYKTNIFVYPGENQLSFVWPSSSKLAGYFIERKMQGEATFKVLNTTPIYDTKGVGFEGKTNSTFSDDSLINYRTYTYRFYGNTAFGERVFFAEVQGMAKDLTPPNPPIIFQPKHIKTKEVKITWQQNGDMSDLRGYIVARSNIDTGNFEVLNKTILPKQTRSFIDSTFNNEGLNYYVIYAFDTAGNISSSYPSYVPLIDSTPPAKPEFISAIIDTLGIVTIRIKQGREKDLKGYRLYKSNSPEHEFSVIYESFKVDKFDKSNFKTILYDTNTLNSLTPKIYYRIKALDFNYNQSGFSEIIAVIRPDIIPPVTPVIKDILVKEDKIELQFVPSESADVKEHIIYRTNDLTAPWTIILKTKGQTNKIIDTNIVVGLIYYYTIRAMDESNLYSEFSKMVFGKPYDSGVRPGVKNLIASKKDSSIILTWEYSNTSKDVFFIIYKKNMDGQLVQYDITSDRIYIDKKISKENEYGVKVKTDDGGQSKMSNIIKP